MADDDVRGASGAGDPFGPTGPRRSSFTPAAGDAESLEAAAHVFNDDAIAEALAAELARVASGPTSIQRPVVVAPPATEPVVPEAPSPVSGPAETALEPVASRAPAAPQGPPDWATPLFGQPTVVPEPREDQSPPPPSDPFAPNEPSFAPSNGPFPPPDDSVPEPWPGAFGRPPVPGSVRAGSNPDALRALYSAAPAPTVPPADAPPPPGYDVTGAFMPPVSTPPLDDTAGTVASQTLSAIEELEAQLDQHDRENREIATDESVNLAYAPPAFSASAPPPPPTEEPVAFLPPPVNEPVSQFAPPRDEPSWLRFAPPGEQPAAFLPPPTGQPARTPALPENDPFDILSAAIEEPAEPAPIPAAPIFLEPAPAFAPPLPDSLVPSPPALVEPPERDGVAELWRAASEEPFAPATSSFATEPIAGPPAWDVSPSATGSPAVPDPDPAVQEQLAPELPSIPTPSAADSAAPFPAAGVPAEPPAGFDDLLSGSADPIPMPPSSAWAEPVPGPPEPIPSEPGPPEPSPPEAAAEQAAAAEKRSFWGRRRARRNG